MYPTQQTSVREDAISLIIMSEGDALKYVSLFLLLILQLIYLSPLPVATYH